MDAKHMVDALLDRGLTQKQIEERTGISQGTISKIVRAPPEKDVMHATYQRLLAVYQKEFGKRRRAEAKAA